MYIVPIEYNGINFHKLVLTKSRNSLEVSQNIIYNYSTIEFPHLSIFLDAKHSSPAISGKRNRDTIMNEIIQLNNDTNIPTLKLKEAMALLRVSRSTFYRLMYAGKIQGQKVGAKWRFHLRDIEAQFQDCNMVRLAS